MKQILSGKGLQSKINHLLIGEVGRVIVEGPVNFELFSHAVCSKKIHIVPNFSEDSLFVSDAEILRKFSNTDVIQILYLSNLIPGKGYNELADGYILLEDSLKRQVNIVFVGGFESLEAKQQFLRKIENHDGMRYLGNFIDGAKKRELYCESHVFCLPTYYPFEGQPISILEAYATGCFVITSAHSGIPSIFSDQINGLVVEKRSSSSIQYAIENLLRHRDKLLSVAFNNRDEAFEKYRTSIYEKSILKIFADIANL